MSITSLDIDDSALEKVLKLSGLRTKKDAVNLALQEYARRHDKIAALERYSALAKDWDYEGWKAIHDAEKGQR